MRLGVEIASSPRGSGILLGAHAQAANRRNGPSTRPATAAAHYNNLIMNQGDGGISAQDYPPLNTRGYIFANNTLINNKNYGMYMYMNTLQNIFINNIIVATNQSGYKYVALNNPSAIKWTASNNIQTADVNSIKFANAGKDYHLTTASALALNVGKDATAQHCNYRLREGTARPQEWCVRHRRFTSSRPQLLPTKLP